MNKEINKRFEKAEARLDKLESLQPKKRIEEGVPIKCHKCGKEWKTISKNYSTSCPGCSYKVPVPKNCFKCKKPIEGKAKYRYGEYFDEKCLKKFSKDSKKEVTEGLNRIS